MLFKEFAKGKNLVCLAGTSEKYLIGLSVGGLSSKHFSTFCKFCTNKNFLLITGVLEGRSVHCHCESCRNCGSAFTTQRDDSGQIVS